LDQQPLVQPEVWEFLQSANPADGVVLVGFGYQNLTEDAAFMKDEWRMMAEALTALAPAKVLWVVDHSKLPPGVKIGEEGYPVGPNVLVVPWVDYNDVLGHPATRLFITHCGSHSCYEAAYHGVPVMTLPFTNEQGEMAMRMLAAGLGYAVPEAVAFRATGQIGGLTKGRIAGIALQVRGEQKL
jgi:UDP:flavonoid glycosyltransferase YjiC (YdhE family)